MVSLGATATSNRADLPPPGDTLFTLLGDQPHVEAKDPLGFDGIVDDLTRLVLASRDSTPFTLGIDAGWGMGKSSLMRKLEKDLDSRDDVETAWFNAWTAEGHSVLEGLIKSVLDKIDPNILRRTMRRKHLMGGFRVAASIVAGLLRVDNLVDKIWDRVASDPRARNQMRDLMGHAMDQWMAKGRTPGRRLLVVFIDDLDRCSPTNVFQVFEAVKLYLDTPGFVFVIGFDSTVVSEAILEEKKYSKVITSRDYLDKIIQIQYRVPVPDDEQVQVFIRRCLESSSTSELFDPAMQSLVVDRNNRNPRKIKRFVNMFVLEYGLDRDWSAIGADNLVKLLILQLYFPDFARLLQGTVQRDPITEFLEYVNVRDLLRRRVWIGADEWPAVVAFAESHKLPAEGEKSPAELLQLLEQDLPETYPSAARDRNFVALLQTFPPEADRTRLREKLEGRYVSALPPVESLSTAPSDPSASDMSLDGVRVLLYSADPQADRLTVSLLVRQGASVETAADYPALVDMMIPPGRFDVLVSDVGRRSGVDDEGVHDIGLLRDRGHYRGPVVFYTSRVTPARREAAAALGALITNDPHELLTLLAGTRLEAPGTQAKPKRRRGAKPSVFIDYRREDTAGHAGRLYDRLSHEFGMDQVFRDVDTIEPGVDFVNAIQAAMRRSDAYICLIGPRWLGSTDVDGRRRIDNADDFVRLTLASALASGIPVIPVLVDGARMPTEAELPEDVRALVRRNALELTDTRWESDVGRLVTVLESLVSPREASTPA